MNLFRVFGIQLSAHWTLWVLLAYFGLEGWSEDRWLGVLLSVLVFVAFFSCIVLHELGHSLTARRFGVRVPRILLTPVGGVAEFDHVPKEPRSEFLITLAGPMVNFVIAAILGAVFGLPTGLPFHPDFEDSFVGIAQLLLCWNVAMGCFNLLPVFPMDGGRLLRAFLALRMPYLRATWWAAKTGRALAAAIVISTVAYIGWNFAATGDTTLRPYMTAILFSFIFFAGGIEYRATFLREQEEERRRKISGQLRPFSAVVDWSSWPPWMHGPN